MKSISAAVKWRRLLAIVVVLLVIAGAGAFLFLMPSRLAIGFYDIDTKLSEKIKSAIDAWAGGAHVKIEYRVLASGSLDAKAARKTDVVFLYPSMANRKSAGLFAPVEPQLIQLVTRGLRDSTAAEGGDWALPLLLDTRELAWKTELFPGGKTPNAVRPSALAAVLAGSRTRKAVTMAAAGGSDAELIDIAGLFVLDRGGIDSYRQLVSVVLDDSAPEAVLAADLGGFTVLEALAPLRALQRQKTLHINWLDLKEMDVIGLVQSGLAGFSLQTLSTHRAMRRDVLAVWSSSPLVHNPDGGGLPVVTASVLALASSKPFRQNTDYGKLCAYLVSADGQRALQQATNLAPAVAAAPAIDIQASEARAAAGGAVVVQGLSRDAFSSDVKRKVFAQTLRTFLASPERSLSSKPAGERKQP